VAVHEAFKTRTGLQKPMKPIGNLPGLGSRLIGRLGRVAGAVTTHHAHLRMGTKPRLDGGAAPIREQIHHLVRLQIDD
jgi:hypothetical protein